MNFSFEIATLVVIQISVLALLGKRLSIRVSKGKINLLWERS